MFSAATKSAHTSSAALYIEDVFSTWLYTGTGASQTITNNINLSGNGGMTWIKSRSAATNNNLFDTTQGATKLLHSNTTAATVTDSVSLTSFNSTGFTLGTGNTTGNQVNTSAATYASWTFREQPKFFDVVTYTGDGVAGRTVAHNLGSVPGMIVVKATSTTGSWVVYHRGAGGGVNPETYNLVLNTTAAQNGSSSFWNSTAPTSTVFTVGASTTNNSGTTYVAYLFAHNAGGFGTSGTDNVISCGSFTTDSSGNATVNLGYEPQYLLIKSASAANGDWYIADTMRGLFAPSTAANTLASNSTSVESVGSISTYINSTGFSSTFTAFTSTTFIYMAIRRPMKLPTLGTTVFNAVSRAGTGATATVTTNNQPDLVIAEDITATISGVVPWFDRLRGVNYYLASNGTAIENNGASSLTAFNNTTFTVGTDTNNVINAAGTNWINWSLTRASGFFDEVCYPGTSVSGTNITHNLTVAPEMMIVKSRDTTSAWWVYHSALGNTKYLVLNSTAIPVTSSTAWNNTTPTSSVFTLGNGNYVNISGANYVAYLFATCPGVSKVGTYTGTGAAQTINCGFTGGARFVLIKRTDAIGDWFVWDTVRGMVSGTDPSIRWNSNGAGQVNANSVYTATTGFSLLASPSVNVNTSGGTYIYLAIA